MANDSNYWTSMYRRRLSRRALLRGSALGAAGLGAAVVLGCGEEAAAPTPTATATAAPTGTAAATGTPAVAVHPDTARGFRWDPAVPVDQMPPPPSWSAKYPDASQLMVKYNYTKLPLETNPKRGGVLHVGGSLTPQHYDIFENTSNCAVYCRVGMFYSFLTRVRWGQHTDDSFLRNNQYRLSITGDAAASLEQPDDTTFIFKLYPNINFQNKPPVNGRQLTAEDVAYSFKRYAGSDNPANYIYEDVASMEAVDKLTFRIKMKRPTAYFLMSTSTSFIMIGAREWAEWENRKNMPIGSGPFMLKQHDEGVKYVLERNPNFYRKDANGTQLPYLDYIDVFTVPDRIAELAQFRAGNIDEIVGQGVDDWKSIVDSMGGFDKVPVVVNPGPPCCGTHVDFVVNKAPWNDIRVRRALSMAINRQVIIDDIYQGGASIINVVPWDYMGFQWPPALKDFGQYQQYNPEQARQLLKEAGYDKGLKVKLAMGQIGSAESSEIALIEAMWKEIGVSLDRDIRQFADFALIYNNRKEFDDDAVWSPTLSFDRDANGYIAATRRTGGPRNYQKLSDPKLDALIDKQGVQLNPEERAKTLREIWSYFNDQAYIIWQSNFWRFGVMQPWVRGWADHMVTYADGGGTVLWRMVNFTDKAPKRSV